MAGELRVKTIIIEDLVGQNEVGVDPVTGRIGIGSINKTPSPFGEVLNAQLGAAIKWMEIPGYGYSPIVPYDSVEASGVRALDLDFSNNPVGTVSNGTVFTDSATGLTFTLTGGNSSIVQLTEKRRGLIFDGNVYLQSNDTNQLKFLHDGSTNYSIYLEYTTSNVTGASALLGNNNYSYFANGVELSVDITNGVNFLVSNNTATPATEHYLTNIAPAGTFESLWVQFEPVRTGTLPNTRYKNELRVYNGGSIKRIENRSSNATFSNINPSFQLQIGSDGQGNRRFTGTISRIVIFKNIINSSGRTVQESNSVVRKEVSNNRYIDTVDMQEISSKYYQGGFFAQHPITQNLVFVTAFSEDHFGNPPAAVTIRRKTNIFTNWSLEKIIFNFPLNNNSWYVPVGGYDSTGRLHMMLTRQNGVSNDEIMYTYSNDEGITWTNPTLVYTSPSYPYLLAHGKLRQTSNGTILIPFYGSDLLDLGGGNFSQSAGTVGVLRSTNGGTSWSVITMTTALAENEIEVIPLSGSNVLACVRKDDTNTFRLWRSSDNGNTWTNLGTTNFGSVFTFKHPPNLEKHIIDGTEVIGVYLGNRNKLRFEAIYATVSQIETQGIAAFTGKTLFEMDSTWKGLGISMGGYPSYHVYDGLKMLGVNYDEELSNDITTQRFFRTLDLHKGQIKTELAI